MSTRQAAVWTLWITIIGTMALSWIVLSVWSLLDAWLRADHHTLERALYDISIGSMIWLLTYGIIFLIPFVLVMVLLDLIMFGIPTMTARAGLLGEWILVALVVVWLAAPFPSVAPFLVLVALLLAQLVRERAMRRMLERRDSFGIAAPPAQVDV